ncbi:MAG TPA: xanthine dehydrogenase family protein molybdopterin-binding subunit, partial [Burkholderiaceae bacterium]|nr:xanthine dehydrogenase family protein molybdopterin-binding subunit [Burkholderiaceae bacterium]
MTNSNPAGRFGSGRAVKRVEDAALLAGKGLFVDNLPVEGQTCIAFQRSPYAHARIVSIDTDAARTMPGVLAVYTGAQLVAAGVKAIAPGPGFQRADGKPHTTPARRALAHEFVRFVGEPVIAVVATS